MLKTQIQSLLFISAKPLTAKVIVGLLKKQGAAVDEAAVTQALTELKTAFNTEESGLHLVETNGQYQMVTNPSQANLIKAFLKEEQVGELTQPALETLTIIAYRGPVSKPVLEQIRGVNCSLIIRNLMIRGLIDVEEREIDSFYFVTTDFLKFLGLNSVNELPDYQKLHEVENLEQFLNNKVEVKN